MKIQKRLIAQALSWEGNSFCKEPFVYWEFGRYRGESQFQPDSANYSYSKMNPFCSEAGEKGKGERRDPSLCVWKKKGA